MSEVEGKIEVETEVAEQAPAVTIENGTTTEVEAPSSDSAMKDIDAPAKDEEAKEEVKDAAKPEVKEETVLTGKDTGKRQSRFTKQNKFDTSSLPESKDPSLIRGQVEFYFSDANLLSDKHLLDLTQSEQNLPVDLKHIHSFKRMRRFQPYSVVVEALKQSSILKITGNEGEELVQRVHPFNEEKAQKDHERKLRSVYVKGFGAEEADTQFEVERFFANYGAYNQVRLRRHDDGLFKGSAFCEYVDVETAQKFLNLDPKPTYKELPPFENIMCREVYEKEKNEKCKSGGVNPQESKFNGRRNNNNKRGGGNFRGDKDDWKNRRDHDRKNGFQGGRGGRGNNRGHGRGNRGGRDNRDKRDHRDNRRDSSAPLADKDAKVPTVKDTSAEAVKSESADEPSKKRAREDDDVNQAASVKKEKLATSETTTA